MAADGDGPAIGLVAPLPPQVGGVASFADWLLQHQGSIGCTYYAFDLRRPPELEAGGRWRLSAGLRQVGVLKAFRRWIGTSPRVVHYCVALTASGLPRDVLFVALLRLRGRRIVAHVHGPAPRNGATRALVGVLHRLSHAHLTVLPLDGWRFVPNPLRIEPRAGWSRRFESAPVRLLSVGSFGVLKGSDVLVDALALVRRSGLAAQLRFVGREIRTGDEELLLARVQERGVEDAVTFAGPRSPDDVPAEYERADVFCLPSRREGLPMALLEAMAFELPVVATAVGAISLFVEDGRTGLVVSVGDPEGLAGAIGRLADPTVRETLGRAGAQAVRETCSPERIAAEWRDIYAEAGR